jgi:hypothetical protein
MAPPLITIAAKLIYFSRREIVPFGIPSHLPLTRAHAIQLGIHDIGPTQEDVVEFNAHTDSKLVQPTNWDWVDGLTQEQLDKELNGDPGTGENLKAPSVVWDNDWWRMRMCHNAWEREGKGIVYIPGTMSGLWQGRMLVSPKPPLLLPDDLLNPQISPRSRAKNISTI